MTEIEAEALAIESEEPSALARVAQAFLRDGRCDDADALFRRNLAIDPTDPQALVGRVTAARRRRAPAAILERCEAALAFLPERPDLRRHATEALLSLGRIPEARRHVTALLALDANAHDTHCAAAALARETGDHEGTLRHGEAALAAKPGDWRLALSCIRALDALGRTTEALDRLESFLAKQPDHVELLNEAGRLARLGGRDADALRHYERAAAIRPGHTKTLIRLADTFRALGSNEAAETSLRQALATRPADTAIMLRLGSLYQAMRRNEPAREMFELACRTNPRLPEPWLCLARLANQVSSFADALRILEEGRQAAGESVPMLLAEIGLLQGRGLVREAEKRLALAEAFDPHDRHVRRQRIDTDIAQGRFVRAAETVARLPGATPAERAQRHLMQGQIAEAQRNPTAARDAFQAALKEDDRLAAAHEGLARARLLLRQPGEARASLVAARQLQAGELIARGRSSTPLRGVLGELINEARIALAAEAGWEPAEMESVQALLRSHRAAPDLTSLTLAVLGSLRRGGRLDPRPEVAGAPLRVPRLIHQYWDMPALPAEVAELMRSWRLENPGWSYRRHDRASARQYLIEHGMPEAARAFAAARQPAQQADLFRLAILLLEGGVYADADDRCVAPLDEALGGVEFLSWQEGLGSVGNNFIAVVPGHPVIASALEQAMEAMFRGDAETMWMSTGPGLLSRSLVQYLAGDTTRLGALGREIVILERWDLRRFCVPHCKTSYKLGGNHWFSRELAQQPK